MKLNKEKIKDNLLTEIVGIIVFSIAMLFLLVTFLMSPFDYLKYKRTQYYKDTHEKYSFLGGSCYYIKLYEAIKKLNLPIEYHRNRSVEENGYGYFIYKDILILNDYEPFYDKDNNVWLVEYEKEGSIEISVDVQNMILKCNRFIGREACKRAVVLIKAELLNKYPEIKYESFEFLPVYNKDIEQALKEFVK